MSVQQGLKNKTAMAAVFLRWGVWLCPCIAGMFPVWCHFLWCVSALLLRTGTALSLVITAPLAQPPAPWLDLAACFVFHYYCALLCPMDFFYCSAVVVLSCPDPSPTWKTKIPNKALVPGQWPPPCGCLSSLPSLPSLSVPLAHVFLLWWTDFGRRRFFTYAIKML